MRPSHALLDRERVEVELIKSLIASYFDIVRVCQCTSSLPLFSQYRDMYVITLTEKLFGSRTEVRDALSRQQL